MIQQYIITFYLKHLIKSNIYKFSFDHFPIAKCKIFNAFNYGKINIFLTRHCVDFFLLENNAVIKKVFFKS